MTGPAWYSDPVHAGWLRWWDGQAWTEHTMLAPLPGPGGAPAPGAPTLSASYWAHPGPGSAAPLRTQVSLARDRADETRLASRAILGLRIGIVVYVGQYIASALVGHHFIHQYIDYFSALRDWDHTGAQPTPPNTGGSQLAVDLIGLALVPTAILFMMWLEKSATIARRAGVPAARSSMWAILGFIVPIVNYWFPYQVARDVFPPDHAGRALVRRWWTLWLVLQFGALLVYGLAYFSTAAALVGAAILAAVAIGCGHFAQQMITAAGTAHSEFSPG